MRVGINARGGGGGGVGVMAAISRAVCLYKSVC